MRDLFYLVAGFAVLAALCVALARTAIRMDKGD